MNHTHLGSDSCCCCRRDFLLTAGAGVSGWALLRAPLNAVAAPLGHAPRRKRETPTVRGAFLYPPSATLREAGYWSWPGSGFDAEGRQRLYTEKLRAIEKDLRMRIAMDERPLDSAEDVARFLADVARTNPDGLLLVPFKKSHWEHVTRIVREAKRPAVVLATLGVLLSDHIRELHRAPGVHMISAADDLDAVASGLRMIRTARRMRESRIVNISGKELREATVPHLGTEIRTIPHARFVELFDATPKDGPARDLAQAYRKGARAVVEPSMDDIVDAARTTLVFREIARGEGADAIMMECLTGLRHPRTHCPPCMGFMTLRDEGVPMGCQSDLSATLSLMLVQELFGRPGFQQNAAMDTERNLYFGSHCTCASRMNGPSGPAAPYELRNHAEAGWGCVPRVLFAEGQELTLTQYRPGDRPQMYIYSGRVVDCPPIPPTGGCRTNVRMTIREVADVCEVKGMHQTIFFGNHAGELRAFCRMHGIEAVS